MLALLTMLIGASADDRREVYRKQLEARKSVKNLRRENYKKAMERKRMAETRRAELPNREAFARNVVRNKQRANRAAAMKK